MNVPSRFTALNEATESLLGRLADEARQRIVGSERVGFVIDRNITFTNYCDIACAFCAFRCKDNGSGFVLSVDDILGKAFVLYWSWDSKEFSPRWSRLGMLIP